MDDDNFNWDEFSTEAKICNAIAANLPSFNWDEFSNEANIYDSIAVDFPVSKYKSPEHPSQEAWRIINRAIKLKTGLDTHQTEILSQHPIISGLADIIFKLDPKQKINRTKLFRVAAQLDRLPPWVRPLENEYTVFRIPKKAGGRREIHSPSQWLGDLQRELTQILNSLTHPHPAAHGFTKNRSIYSNTLPHCEKKLVVRLDIKDAFSSTTRKIISRTLQRDLQFLNLNKSAIYIIEEIVTFKNSLATGAPSSPLLLNRALYEFDQKISEIGQISNISYTRYADDIALSGDNPLHLIGIIKSELKNIGFDLNIEKTRIYKNTRRQIITGLVCNKKPSVPKETRKKIRAMINNYKKTGRAYWNGKEISESAILGHINFLNISHPDIAQKIRKEIEIEKAQREVTGLKE